MYSWSKKDPQTNARIDAKVKENHSTVDWYMYCREICTLAVSSRAQERIGGPWKVVEIGERKFGKKKYHKGKRVLGQWVFGRIERGSENLACVPKVDVKHHEPH